MIETYDAGVVGLKPMTADRLLALPPNTDPHGSRIKRVRTTRSRTGIPYFRFTEHLIFAGGVCHLHTAHGRAPAYHG